MTLIHPAIRVSKNNVPPKCTSLEIHGVFAGKQKVRLAWELEHYVDILSD